MKFSTRICMSILVSMASLYVNAQAPQAIKPVSIRAQSLQEEHIENFKKQITEELERNIDIRAGAKGVCYAGGATIALLACYKLIKDLSIVHHDELVDMKRCFPTIQTICASYVFRYNDDVQAAVSGLVVQKENTGFLSACSSWGSTLVRFAGQTALSSFIAHIAQKIVSSVFHEHSIKWILHNKTLLPDLSNQLEAIKKDISNLKDNKTPLEISDYNYYVEALVSLHNGIAEQLEFVVGYMRYRLSSLPLAAAGDLPDTKTVYLSNRIAFVANLLNAEIKAYKLSSTNEDRVLKIVSMYDALEQLMLQITTALTQFEVVEKKMKQSK